MISDLNQLDDKVSLQADLCIIGAGAAGITLAREFRNTNLKVLVLESGGFEVDPDTQKLCDEETTGDLPTDNKMLYVSRLRSFGGSTNHWAGCCRPLSDLDFQKRDWVPHSGWPISKSDLVPFYLRAKNLCQLQNISGIGENEEPKITNLQFTDSAELVTHIYNFGPPTRFGSVYREELQQVANIHVILSANLTQVKSNSEATNIQSITAKSLAGKSLQVNAKYFILATGGIENARILLAANDVNKMGLGNSSDTVGRYYADHPDLTLGTFAFWKTESQLDPYIFPSDGSRNFNAKLSPTELAQKSRQSMNFYVDLTENRPAYSPTKEGNAAEALQDFFYGKIVDGEKRSCITHSFHMRWEQAPNPESRVTLSDKVNALGTRQARLTWKFQDLDRQTIKTALNLTAREMGRSGLGRVHYQTQDNLPLDEYVRSIETFRKGYIAPSFHHCGTTRMNSDPKKGVVDRNCKVFGIQNLYIAGSSVFTTAGVAHPTLTIVALALRLADHLKGKLS